MKYKLPISSFSDGERMELTGIEARISHFIKGSIESKTEYKQLSITLSTEVDAFMGERFTLVHNASTALNGSYQLSADINDYLRKLQIPKLSSPYTLRVTVNFKEKQDTAKREQTQQFRTIEPRYCFDQIILPDNVKQEVMEGIAVVKNQKLIYDTWGFKDVDPIPKSVLSLYGPPGTGKTMVAHAIAKELNRPLLALKYSEIESKYLGDATKNLMAAFNTAKEQDAVIFFDEADSFLGKRVENVTQSSDQALNSLRSQMLILLEEHKGTVVFATNLVTNFDPAFESRILKHIKLDLPNKEARAEIIRKMIPAKLPVDCAWSDEQILSASEEIEGLSGREIKGAILEMLLSKANTEGENAVFCFDDLLQTMKNKKTVIEQLKAEEDLRLKRKIMRKFKEKAEEEQATAEYEKNKEATSEGTKEQ